VKRLRVLWLWGLFTCSSPALAQGGSGHEAAPAQDGQIEVAVGDAAADEEGRGFFIAGRAAYLAGRYEEALERFERSYEKSGRPELLYNVGTAAERAGKLARALEAYRQYLERQPESERRGEVETHIAQLEARVAAEPAEPAPLTPASDAASTAAPKATSVLGPSLTLATSGAALVTGAVLVVLGYQARQRVQDAPQGAKWSDYSNDAQQAVSFRAAGFAVAAVGVVGTALSSWWLAKARKDARSSAPVLGVGYLGWRGSF
jgi:tetratricopeptide (TPR) repeat protein